MPAPEGSLTFKTSLPALGLAFRKTYSRPRTGYLLDLEVEVAALRPVSLQGLSLRWGPGLGQPDPEDRSNFLSAAALFPNAFEKVSPVNSMEVKQWATAPRWLALRNHYFTLALIPDQGPWSGAEVPRQASQFGAGLTYSGQVGPEARLRLRAGLFGGPQEYSLLKSLGMNLQKIVNFGWFEIFAIPMLYVLNWFYLVTHNYGLAIILLTILVRALVWYPTHKGMTSMKHM